MHTTKLYPRRALAFIFAVVLVVCLPGVTSSRPLRPQTPATFEARVETLLKQTGYQYRKVKQNSWYLIITGKQLPQIRILLGAGPSSIAVGAVVVKKQNLRISGDALQKMMKLSYDLNYVRVCIDNDDDLIVMAQVKEAWLDSAEFKATIDRVAAAADRAYAEMRPFVAP